MGVSTAWIVSGEVVDPTFILGEETSKKTGWICLTFAKFACEMTSQGPSSRLYLPTLLNSAAHFCTIDIKAGTLFPNAATVSS